VSRSEAGSDAKIRIHPAASSTIHITTVVTRIVGPKTLSALCRRNPLTRITARQANVVKRPVNGPAEPSTHNVVHHVSTATSRTNAAPSSAKTICMSAPAAYHAPVPGVRPSQRCVAWR